MTEAKELLSKMLIAFQNKTVWQDHDYCSELVEECRRFLRKPEPEPKPLTEQEILDCAEKTWHKFDLDNDVNFKGLVNIVREIEKTHSIGSHNDN